MKDGKVFKAFISNNISLWAFVEFSRSSIFSLFAMMLKNEKDIPSLLESHELTGAHGIKLNLDTYFNFGF